MIGVCFYVSRQSVCADNCGEYRNIDYWFFSNRSFCHWFLYDHWFLNNCRSFDYCRLLSLWGLYNWFNNRFYNWLNNRSRFRSSHNRCLNLFLSCSDWSSGSWSCSSCSCSCCRCCISLLTADSKAEKYSNYEKSYDSPLSKTLSFHLSPSLFPIFHENS